ncbi:MATE family efflux transporter [Clostridium folliculivorans]|uniref:Probable multidrug resistance protein NorM n=1 Tax=Clostridium folliculivorans TaxID=2886038 RepID=A0A9W6DAC6_9CLOT|nr:MATE family efflux transporter [Clostridium folliculivorans]GKU24692.1 MATE family efflux transporter [Clostridium folliculivorans]GKU30790.1 MATE family efflux transporter [Clostridium folliculivorans]
MNTDSRKNLILNGSMYKVILTLSLPIMISNLIQTLYNLVDGIWVGKLGSVQFAATSFVWPVIFLFISIGSGISIAGTSLLSQLIGASKYEKASKYASQLIVISVICAVIFSALGYLISPIIIKLMGASGDLAYYSNIFLKITFLDMPFTFIFFSFNAIMNSQGNTMMSTILSGCSVILNVILDPILIFNLNLGMAGAPVATLIAKAVLAFVGLYILHKSKSEVKPNFRDFRFDIRLIKRIFRVAIPSAIGQSGSALGFIVLNGFIASYGTATIAAFGMVNRITSLIMQPAMGVGAALTAIVGQNLGSDKVHRVKEAFIKAVKLTMTFSIIGGILMVWKDEPIINFFIQSKDDPSVITQGITYLIYISFSMPLMGLFSIYQGIFQGSGHTRYSMNMEVGRLWFVRLPMILLFKYITSAGPVGIWFSMSFSNLIVCIYGYIVYRKGKWQKKQV